MSGASWKSGRIVGLPRSRIRRANTVADTLPFPAAERDGDRSRHARPRLRQRGRRPSRQTTAPGVNARNALDMAAQLLTDELMDARIPCGPLRRFSVTQSGAGGQSGSRSRAYRDAGRACWVAV